MTGLFSPTRRISFSWIARRSLAWNGERGLRDLVEEEGAAVGLLEEALARADGAGERAARVPEELALQQRLGHRRAVDRRRTGRSARLEFAWMALATSSLPVPLSPVMSTVASVGATFTMRPSTSRIAAERPTMFSNL
jgi:hypothetical protein